MKPGHNYWLNQIGLSVMRIGVMLKSTALAFLVVRQWILMIEIDLLASIITITTPTINSVSVSNTGNIQTRNPPIFVEAHLQNFVGISNH